MNTISINKMKDGNVNKIKYNGNLNRKLNKIVLPKF